MFDPKILEELPQKLYEAMPKSLQKVEKDIQQKFKDILQSAFAKMDLVTREEFDVQTKVLARTREKVESLQYLVDDLLKNKK